MTLPTCIDRRFETPGDLFEVLARDYWGRAPVIFRNHGLGALFGSEEAICAGLVANAARNISARIYADDDWAPSVEENAFSKDDESLRTFVDRLAALHSAREVLVVTDSFERSHPALWFACAPTLQALFRAVGFPAGRAQVNLFAGRYSRTPFKFHKDVADSLTHVLEGRKRYLIWSFDDVAQHLRLPPDARHENVRFDGFDYHAIRDRAVVLDAQPDDLVYWPWDCFHLAEPHEAGFSAAISFGVAPFASPFEGLDAFAKQRPGAMRVEAYSTGREPQREELDPIRAVLADDEFVRFVERRAVERRSRFGFLDPLPRAHVELSAVRKTDTIRATALDLLCWSVYEDRILVAANGHAFSLDRIPGIEEIFKELNQGRALTVAELRTRLSSDEGLESDEVDALVAHLLGIRAIAKSATAVVGLERVAALLDSDDLFPLRVLDGGETILLATVGDAEHGRIEGFSTSAVRVPSDDLVLHFERSSQRAIERNRYVFTGGYSGSTLLCRALDTSQNCVCIHEPRALSDWSLEYGKRDREPERSTMRRLLETLTATVFAKRSSGRSPVVKVGAHVQELMPLLLDGDARAIHLYTALPQFLANTLKDESRRRDLRMVAEAPERARAQSRLGLSPIDVSRHSDAEAIACTWLTDFALHEEASQHSTALAAISLEDLLRAPDDGMRWILAHLQLGLSETVAPPWRDAFMRHSKRRGERFDALSRAAVMDRHLQQYRAEIDNALGWARGWWGRELPHRLGRDFTTLSLNAR